jgi:hypothetical protein
MSDPFAFMSEVGAIRWTGYRAEDLEEFAHGLERVSGSSIYYHFYHSLYRRHFLAVDYMHDPARWVLTSLNLPPLAERLAQIDPVDFASIRAARDRMVEVVRSFMGEAGEWIRIPCTAPFYFLEQDSLIFPTGVTAAGLSEFAVGLERVGETSLYYHLIEARLRLERHDNDFSTWLERSLGEKDLAEEIRDLNVHRRPIHVTRKKVLEAVRRRIRATGGDR